MSKAQGYAIVAVLMLLAMGGSQVVGAVFGLGVAAILISPVVGVARLGSVLGRRTTPQR